MLYPILEISREMGDAALLLHEWTSEERALFSAMDSACVQLPEDTELEVFHARVAQIGALHGLDFHSSVALWTRLTFALFEPLSEPDSSPELPKTPSRPIQPDSSVASVATSSHTSGTDSSVTAPLNSSCATRSDSSRA